MQRRKVAQVVGQARAVAAGPALSETALHEQSASQRKAYLPSLYGCRRSKAGCLRTAPPTVPGPSAYCDDIRRILWNAPLGAIRILGGELTRAWLCPHDAAGYFDVLGKIRLGTFG